jgi:acylphosphatase
MACFTAPSRQFFCRTNRGSGFHATVPPARRRAGTTLTAYRRHVLRYRVLISGRVQGVFFRDACRRMAEQDGVAGWVRNLPDGRVEVVFEGEDEAVRRLVDWAHGGPRLAEVSGIAVQAEPLEGLTTFRIK